MNPRPVALLAALLPFFAVHLTYFVAAGHGLVDWCLPYFDSCTSISATGRHPPASYLFRATMLPSAVIFLAYWWLTRAWLRVLVSGGRAPLMDWMLGLGTVACCGLVAYVTVLGEAGDLWQRQRRVGVVLFFAFTFLAQLLLAAQLRRLGDVLPGARGWTRAMLANCVLMLALGIATLVWDALNPGGYDTVEDAFEWVLAFLLQVNFLLGYLLWRGQQWRLVVEQPGGYRMPDKQAIEETIP